MRAQLNNPVPPKNYVAYLQDKTVMKEIGAQGEYQGCNAGIYALFQAIGGIYVPLPSIVHLGVDVR